MALSFLTYYQKTTLLFICSATLTSISISYFLVSLLSWFLQYAYKLITMQNEYIMRFQIPTQDYDPPDTYRI